MTETTKIAKLVGKDGMERQINGAVSVTHARGHGTLTYNGIVPGLDLLDAEGKAIAWVNPDETWLIAFTEQ